jgi:hypothetical protein
MSECGKSCFPDDHDWEENPGAEFTPVCRTCGARWVDTLDAFIHEVRKAYKVRGWMGLRPGEEP